jgi:hypothetical protein
VPPFLSDLLARGVDQAIVTEFPLRLLVPLEDAQVQGTVRFGIEECAVLAREKAAWKQTPDRESPGGDGPTRKPR